MPSFGRRGAPVDWLIVGLGNPGAEYESTPHNIGFEVVRNLLLRWQFAKPKAKYRGLFVDGPLAVDGDPNTDPPTPSARLRLAVLMPQTYMNEAGKSVGPARGDHIIVVHDEIDLPFGEIRTRLGGGLAGHNGLKSIKAALGTAEFHRVRVGVGRPPTTDPERVAAFVLGKFKEPRAEVAALTDSAADEVIRMLS
jgi:PTH1 family peptidyl-tRNA hydrolase